MRKQIKLFTLVLSFFFFFSCSQIAEHNTALKIALPSASSLQVSTSSQSRNLAFTYSIADVTEYQIVLNRGSESKSYTGKPGETLIIENLQEGEYELLGYAKNADAQIIGYAATKVTVKIGEENNVPLAIKKNIIENIQSITPAVDTKNQVVVFDNQEFNIASLLSEMKVNINYKSGYKVQTPLADLLASGYYRTGYSLLSENNEVLEGNIVTRNAKSCKLTLYAPDCSIQDFVAAMGNNGAIDTLFANKKTVFDFSYALVNNAIYYVMFNDEYTVISSEVLFDKTQEAVLQTPVLEGFTFNGWYFYDKEGKQTLISGNKIAASDVNNFVADKGYFRAHWLVSNFDAIDCTKFKAEDYPTGFTLNLGNSFGANIESDIAKLTTAVSLFVATPACPQVNISISSENKYVTISSDNKYIVSKTDSDIFYYDLVNKQSVNHATFTFFEDSDIASGTPKTFNRLEDITLESPASRNGFVFKGWKFVYGENNQEMDFSSNVIPLNRLDELIELSGRFIGQWTVTNCALIDETKFTSLAYPNGVTLCLDSSFGSIQKDADLSALQACISRFKTKNMPVILDMELCTYITSLDYYDDGTLKTNIFSGYTNLYFIKLPSTIGSIPGYCFKDSGLIDIFIPEGVVEICASAFENCSSLKIVEIPSTVTLIDSEAFTNSVNIENVLFSNNTTYYFTTDKAIMKIDGTEIIDFDPAVTTANRVTLRKYASEDKAAYTDETVDKRLQKTLPAITASAGFNAMGWYYFSGEKQKKLPLTVHLIRQKLQLILMKIILLQ